MTCNMLFVRRALQLLALLACVVQSYRLSSIKKVHNHCQSTHVRATTESSTPVEVESIKKGLNLRDLYEDSLTEVAVPRLLTVQGNIPSYVKGTMLRNGPSVFGALPRRGTDPSKNDKLKRFTHIFDGLARVNSYRFTGDGNVEFSTKLIRGKNHEQIVKKRKNLPPSVYTGPVKPAHSRIQNILGATTATASFDNCNVNIHQMGGEDGTVVAVTDAPVMMPLDAGLNTKGKVQYPNPITTSRVGVELFSTAHPHTLPGDKFSFNYYFELKPIGGANCAHIVRLDKDFQRKVVGTVELGKEVPYVHDFSLTDKYAILAIWPIRNDLSTTVNGKGFLRQLVWEGDKPGAKTTIYVFDIEKAREAGGSSATSSGSDSDKAPESVPLIAVFETEPLWAYHHINAYEETVPIRSEHEDEDEDQLSKNDAPDTHSASSTSYVENLDAGADETESNANTSSNSRTQTQLVVDIVGYKNADIINGPNGYLYIDSQQSEAGRRSVCKAGVYHRLTLPLSVQKNDERVAAGRTAGSTGTGNGNGNRGIPFVPPQLLHARDGLGNYYETEMVTVSPAVKGKRHRYSYGMTMYAGNPVQQYEREVDDSECNDWSLVKVDHFVAAEESRSSAAVDSVSADSLTASELPPVLEEDGNGNEADDSTGSKNDQGRPLGTATT